MFSRLSSAILLCSAATAVSAGTITMDFKACIDGRSQLLVQGNTLQWHNLTFTVPGLHTSCPAVSGPTLVSTTLDAANVLTDTPWTPSWSSTSGDVLSSIFNGLTPGLPASPLSVTLTTIQARGSLSIFQLPTSGNGGVLILDFDDNAPGGAALYEGLVTITTSEVPEPGHLPLLGVLLAAGWAKRRFRRAG